MDSCALGCCRINRAIELDSVHLQAAEQIITSIENPIQAHVYKTNERSWQRVVLGAAGCKGLTAMSF